MRPGLSIVLVALAGCATAKVDRSERVGAEEKGVKVEEVPVNGFRAVVREESDQTHDGELLAVDSEDVSLLVATPEGPRLDRVPRAGVASLEIRDVFASYAGAFGVWTVLGMLSTGSHGYYSILSMPVWLFFGLTVSVGSALGNDVAIEANDLDRAREYARFPQGLPSAWRRSPPPRPLPPVRTATTTTSTAAWPASTPARTSDPRPS